MILHGKKYLKENKLTDRFKQHLLEITGSGSCESLENHVVEFFSKTMKKKRNKNINLQLCFCITSN